LDTKILGNNKCNLNLSPLENLNPEGKNFVLIKTCQNCYLDLEFSFLG
jgi:hypothetical protein